MTNQVDNISIPRTIRRCGLIFTLNDFLSDTEIAVYDWATEVPFTSSRIGEVHKVERHFDGQRSYSIAIIRDAIFSYQDDMVQAAYRDIVTYLLDIKSEVDNAPRTD